MAAFDDLSQKIIIVVLFTSVFVVIWLIVKQRGSLGQSTAVQGHITHVESRRLAHANVLSVFEINQRTVLILQGKQGATALDITPEIAPKIVAGDELVTARPTRLPMRLNIGALWSFWDAACFP
jgi:hypothetical protein